MEQRVSLITLGVADLARARAFYEALGWTTRAGADDDVVFFQTGGMIVALWGRTELAEDSGVEDTGGWGGVTLAHNVRSPAEVDAVRRRDGPARGRGDVLGRLLGCLRRSGRSSVGGRTQSALDSRRGRLDAPRRRLNTGGSRRFPRSPAPRGSGRATVVASALRTRSRISSV
jgi:catechol 2,3-dioxygenase-like lactoylglutathione lyase family enzyme